MTRPVAGAARRRVVAVVGLALALVRVDGAAAQRLSVGIKQGIARQDMWNDAHALDQRGGLTGVSLGLRLGSRVELRSEALRTGSTLRGLYQSTPWSVDRTYLQVPLFARLLLPVARRGPVPMAYAGPWVSFELSCRYSHTYVSPADPACAPQGVRKSRQAGLAWGGGVVMPVGPADLELDVRGEASFTRLDVPLHEVNVGDGPYSQSGIAGFVGLAVPLGRRPRAGALAQGNARPPRAPEGEREPLAPGDRVRADLVLGSVDGQVVASYPDSLVIETPDPRYAGRVTLLPNMVRCVRVSLGRRSPAGATLLGSVLGGVLAIPFAIFAHQEKSKDAQPLAVALPVLGALIGHTRPEAWREAAFPAERLPAPLGCQ